MSVADPRPAFGTGEPAPEAFEGHELDSPEYRRISIALFLAGVATFALLYSTQPLLPMLSTHFGVSAANSALSVSAATMGLGASLLAVGPVSEVAGRTRLMIASLFASPVVGLIIALAPSWPALIALRVLQGVVLAGLPAVAMAYLAEELSRASQARAAGLYVGGTALGGMAGRLITGAIADVGGWRWALGGIAAVGIACAAAVALLLPRSRGFHPAPRSLRHLAHQTKAILTEPALVALFVIAGTSMGAFVGVFNAMAFRLEAAPYSLSVGVAGLVFVVYALGSISSAQAGRLAGRHGQRAVEPIAALIMLAGVLVTLATPLPLVMAGLAVMTVGFFAVHGVASGWVAARATLGVGAAGQASSAYLFWYYLGSSLFGSLAGTAWAANGWPAVVALAAGLVSVTLAASLWLRRVPRLTPPHRPDPQVAGH